MSSPRHLAHHSHCRLPSAPPKRGRPSVHLEHPKERAGNILQPLQRLSVPGLVSLAYHETLVLKTERSATVIRNIIARTAITGAAAAVLETASLMYRDQRLRQRLPLDSRGSGCPPGRPRFNRRIINCLGSRPNGIHNTVDCAGNQEEQCLRKGHLKSRWAFKGGTRPGFWKDHHRKASHHRLALSVSPAHGHRHAPVREATAISRSPRNSF